MALHTLTGFQIFPLFASDAGVTGRSSVQGVDPTLGLPRRAAKSTPRERANLLGRGYLQAVAR